MPTNPTFPYIKGCKTYTTYRNHTSMHSQFKTGKFHSQAATPPTKNAWSKKFVPTMEDFPQTLTAVRAPTLKHTVEVARPQVARPKPVATKTVVTDQRRQTSFVPRPVQRTVESQRCGVALKSPSPPQEEELEAIAIALNGATALLRRVSTGKRHLIPALQKMIEAALDALKTLSA